MKISKLVKLAGVFFALALATTTIFAQGYGNRNNKNWQQEAVCLDQISGLTEYQKAKIQELETSHRASMDELRTERRSSANADKDEIRNEMLKKVEAHQAEVKNLLNESQQKEYDLLHYQSNNRRSSSQNSEQGYRSNRGNSGNGGQQFVNGNRGGCQGNQRGCRQRGNW